jgi:hypothetical protein
MGLQASVQPIDIAIGEKGDISRRSIVHTSQGADILFASIITRARTTPRTPACRVAGADLVFSLPWFSQVLHLPGQSCGLA